MIGGLLKTAITGHNNLGLEFHHSSGDQSMYTDRGGMAPRGIETHDAQAGINEKQTSARLRRQSIARRLFYKEAFVTYTGKSSDAASTLATQLKYESSTPRSHEQIGDDREQKERDRRFARSKKS